MIGGKQMTLEQAIQSCKDLSEWFENYGAGTELYEYGNEHRQIAEWLEDYKEIKETTRWIPCSERMPDSPIRCAVITENGGYGVSRYMGRNIIEWSLLGEIVTHWMQLPETPKGEER